MKNGRRLPSFKPLNRGLVSINKGLNMEIQINRKSGNIKLTGIVFLGTNIGEVVLTDFMKEMERSPYFKRVILESSRKVVTEEKKAISFIISCTIQE